MPAAEQQLDAIQELLSGGVSPAIAAQEVARVRRIAEEATRAFTSMARMRRGVAIFGSAQAGATGRWGSMAEEVGRALGKAGFSVITGGGPGLMAAANKGALSSGGASVGLTIQLPIEEPANEFLTLEVPFYYFFLRKLAFVKYSCAFVLMPGGYGTLDELFEALNLRRTHRLDPFPVILMGSGYWTGLLEWLRSEAVGAGTLLAEDLELVTISDNVANIVRIVEECHATLCRELGIVDDRPYG